MQQASQREDLSPYLLTASSGPGRRDVAQPILTAHGEKIAVSRTSSARPAWTRDPREEQDEQISRGTRCVCCTCEDPCASRRAGKEAPTGKLKFDRVSSETRGGQPRARAKTCFMDEAIHGSTCSTRSHGSRRETRQKTSTTTTRRAARWDARRIPASKTDLVRTPGEEWERLRRMNRARSEEVHFARQTSGIIDIRGSTQCGARGRSRFLARTTRARRRREVFVWRDASPLHREKMETFLR